MEPDLAPARDAGAPLSSFVTGAALASSTHRAHEIALELLLVRAAARVPSRSLRLRIRNTSTRTGTFR